LNAHRTDSAEEHQSALHFLLYQLPANPLDRQRVIALVQDHEARCLDACRDEASGCAHGLACASGQGCPMRGSLRN
jgi:hypothetical protein